MAGHVALGPALRAGVGVGRFAAAVGLEADEEGSEDGGVDHGLGPLVVGLLTNVSVARIVARVQHLFDED